MQPSTLTGWVRVISDFCCNKFTLHYRHCRSGKLFLAQEKFGVLFIRHLQEDFHEALQVRKNTDWCGVEVGGWGAREERNGESDWEETKRAGTL